MFLCPLLFFLVKLGLPGFDFLLRLAGERGQSLLLESGGIVMMAEGDALVKSAFILSLAFMVHGSWHATHHQGCMCIVCLTSGTVRRSVFPERKSVLNHN